MPRLTGPLFSLDARQTLAKTIVYSAWKGLNYARIRVIPYNPKSAAQQGVRTSLTYGVQYWRDGTVSAGQKFNDADLVGLPYRVVISKRTGYKLEPKKRNKKDTKLISLEELLKLLKLETVN